MSLNGTFKFHKLVLVESLEAKKVRLYSMSPPVWGDWDVCWGQRESSVWLGQRTRSSLQIPAPHCNPGRTCHRCGSRPGPPGHVISETGTERSVKRQTRGSERERFSKSKYVVEKVDRRLISKEWNVTKKRDVGGKWSIKQNLPQCGWFHWCQAWQWRTLVTLVH